MPRATHVENVVSKNDRTVTVELARGDVDARRDQPSRCASLLPLSFYSQSRSPVNTEGFPNPYESHSLQPERAFLVWPDFFARRSPLNIHSPCRGKLAMRAGHPKLSVRSPRPARRRDRNEYPFPFPCAPDRHYCCACP